MPEVRKLVAEMRSRGETEALQKGIVLEGDLELDLRPWLVPSESERLFESLFDRVLLLFVWTAEPLTRYGLVPVHVSASGLSRQHLHIRTLIY